MTQQDWLKKKCVPCEGGIPPIPKAEAGGFMKDIPSWTLAEDGKSIRRSYRMKDFMAAVGFISAVAQIAESEDHHPDIHLTGYRNLTLELSTHAIGGLSENDFILAAKIENLSK